ncbi:MAG: MFS transporter [Streptosporangiales bacterium]|nr:MFS transporter [Streptosporangiales bacterium]
MRRFVGFGLLGRVAISMMSLGVILLISGLTGSYTDAGLLAGIGVLSGAVGMPVLGRLADRYGQSRVTLFAIPLHGVGLVSLVLLAVLRTPVWALLPSAFVMGAAYPPIGSFVRARWSARLGGTPRLTTAYAFESVVDELIFVTGPVLATLLSTRVHPGAGLAAALLFTLVGGIGFARQRATDPARQAVEGRRASAVRTPVVHVVVLVNLTAGTALGSIDVAVVAFTSAAGVRWASGLVLALFAAGSAIGGLAFGAVPWRIDPLWRFAGTGTLLGLLFLPLVFAPSVGWLLPLGFLSGLGISPLIVASNTLVERGVRRDRLTEALTWLTTGLLVGVAAGSWLTGRVVDVTDGFHGFHVVTPAALVTAAAAWLAWLRLRRAPGRESAR